MEMTIFNVRRLVAFVLCSILLLIGCSRYSGDQVVDSDIESKSEVNGGSVSADAPEVRLITVDEFQATLSSHAGRVVLLDMWATW